MFERIQNKVIKPPVAKYHFSKESNFIFVLDQKTIVRIIAISIRGSITFTKLPVKFQSEASR
ncbi:MAG: hypothetical protein COZ91_03060 [Candidatus Nealsonbacteria bacterium CG_4_8_14_3_um_filter_39_7]|nr:MAG: hypothetical protein COZ91_03060 [Candidatus Nealsonbacteria bacterium CG_4_8_14_3_um_filter_39_7]